MKKASNKEISTEEKIKVAARTVFTKKGYAGTRTRDIAKEAGINLALLNYYFRSKEKLFELIMMEKMTTFFGGVTPLLNDVSLTLEQKVSAIAGNYIDLLMENPDLPLFILSEIRMNPEQFDKRLPLNQIGASHLFKQLREKRPDLQPIQFLMNMLGLTVFPFIMKPILAQSSLLSEKAFQAQMLQRKELIPKWIRAMLKVT
ncbi:MAG: TetR family transcriptional regulator [Chryseolinea sp.]